MKKKICFGLYGIFLLLSACSIISEAPIFMEKVCEAPCWQGIQPGNIDEEQAIEKLRNLKGIKKNTIHKAQAPQFGYPWEIFWEFESWGSGWLAIDDQQTIAEIGFTGQELTLGKYIAELGDPDKVVILPSTNNTKNVEIIYTSKNVIIQYLKSVRSGNIVHIDYGDIVEDVHYCSSEALKMNYLRVPNGLYVTSITEIWQDWRGVEDYHD